MDELFNKIEENMLKPIKDVKIVYKDKEVAFLLSDPNEVNDVYIEININGMTNKIGDYVNIDSVPDRELYLSDFTTIDDIASYLEE